jgi:solute:Na+ symporter, SSS family
VLLLDDEGLLHALQQWSPHLASAHGMALEVESSGAHRIEEGTRVVIFQVVQDLLIYMARCNGLERARVVLGHEGGRHVVRVEPSGAPANLAPRGRSEPEDARPLEHDVLAHARERLYQINGHIEAAPSLDRAAIVTVTATAERR